MNLVLKSVTPLGRIIIATFEYIIFLRYLSVMSCLECSNSTHLLPVLCKSSKNTRSLFVHPEDENYSVWGYVIYFSTFDSLHLRKQNRSCAWRLYRRVRVFVSPTLAVLRTHKNMDCRLWISRLKSNTCYIAVHSVMTDSLL